MQISGPGTGDRWFHDRVDSQRREIYHLGHVRKWYSGWVHLLQLSGAPVFEYIDEFSTNVIKFISIG